jgi:hypothetical protein
LKPKTTTLTSQMTKFFIHGIPTFYTPEVRQDIENAYPTVKLIESPIWLTSPKKRAKTKHRRWLLPSVDLSHLKII